MGSSTPHLMIFDTTLRDGEQSPGASMTREEKLRIASALERLRVDVIEAGFPIASPDDFAVRLPRRCARVSSARWPVPRVKISIGRPKR